MVDSGDGATMDVVTAFCRHRARRKVMAGKGMSGTRPFIKAAPQKSGDTLWLIGVDGIKTALFDRLRTGRHFRFSADLDLDWFEQLCGERMVVRYRKGVPRREFVPVRGRRNEALDCVVYGMAAHARLTVNFDRRESELRNEPQASRPRQIQSQYLNTGDTWL